MGGNSRAFLGCAVIAGIFIIGSFVFFSLRVADFRRRQASLSEPVALEPSSPAESEAEASPPRAEEPLAPARIARALERFGDLAGWEGTEEPCPQALPVPSVEVRRTPAGATGRRVITPEPPFPIRIARDRNRALAALDEPVMEPTLVLLRDLWVRPSKTSRSMFRPGKAAGRAFLRVPGNDGILCVGDYSATSSERVAADSSELPVASLDNELAITVDLVLRERRAAVESLRAARRRARD